MSGVRWLNSTVCCCRQHEKVLAQSRIEQVQQRTSTAAKTAVSRYFEVYPRTTHRASSATNQYCRNDSSITIYPTTCLSSFPFRRENTRSTFVPPMAQPGSPPPHPCSSSRSFSRYVLSRSQCNAARVLYAGRKKNSTLNAMMPLSVRCTVLFGLLSGYLFPC